MTIYIYIYIYIYIWTRHDKDTDKLKSLDIRKILINNTKIIYKNNNKKNGLQILKSITIKNRIKKPTINKIAFNIGIKHIKPDYLS